MISSLPKFWLTVIIAPPYFLFHKTDMAVTLLLCISCDLYSVTNESGANAIAS